MGVPKFFRWLVERYPCSITAFNEATLPSIDNLYLDMNGIIHNCARQVGFHVNNEMVYFKEISAYVEKLFALTRPRKHFFLAIDGNYGFPS
jgi:5'-3' exoribonuclease 1